MKQVLLVIQLQMIFLLLTSFHKKEEPNPSLTIRVNNLRNSNGVVQFTLYTTPDGFPDKHYKKYYRKSTAKIENGNSELTFQNLPAGEYALNILHDEDSNGKRKKGLLLPKEGIGFSNYQSIGISNRPVFQKASFELLDDTKMNVRIIYF